MRLRTLAPLHLDDDELARRQRRYRRLAPPPLAPAMANLPATPEVPRRLENEAACRASDAAVYAEALRSDPGAFDAILLDCVLDPALEALQRDAPLPVFGILRLAAGHLAALGHKLAAVTRNRAIGDELERRIDAFGLAGIYRGTVVLDLAFDAIADTATWNAALHHAMAQAAASGATALINGCSAVDVEDEPSLLLVDPTALALELIAAAASGRRTPPVRARGAA